MRLSSSNLAPSLSSSSVIIIIIIMNDDATIIVIIISLCNAFYSIAQEHFTLIKMKIKLQDITELSTLNI